MRVLAPCDHQMMHLAIFTLQKAADWLLDNGTDNILLGSARRDSATAWPHAANELVGAHLRPYV
jgi:hypothetical protein